MKYLKRFNEEYTRTIGFRYSEPKIKMSITAVYTGELTNQLLTSAFNEFEIKIGDIDINKRNGIFEGMPVDGSFTINFFVYNDRKDDMESLVQDIGDYLSNRNIMIRILDFKKSN